MFSTQIKVRFNHCDPAGIVFYPRYYEMLNQVVEEWFENHLGLDFRVLIQEHGAGIPAVSLDVDFMGVSRLGDILTFELSVEAVGTSSIKLTIAAKGMAEPRLKANMVLVYVKHSPRETKAQPVPEHLKEKMLST